MNPLVAAIGIAVIVLILLFGLRWFAERVRLRRIVYVDDPVEETGDLPPPMPVDAPVDEPEVRRRKPRSST